MRYINRQPHANTCGPTAIVNILRSFGVNASYEAILKECGGLKKVGKRGMLIDDMIRVLRKHNIEAVPYSLPRRKMLKLAKDPRVRIALCYVWLKQIEGIPGRKDIYTGGGHVVMVDPKTGKGINSNKASRIHGQRWRDTKAYWGFPPISLVCMPRKGGVR